MEQNSNRRHITEASSYSSGVAVAASAFTDKIEEVYRYMKEHDVHDATDYSEYDSDYAAIEKAAAKVRWTGFRSVPDSYFIQYEENVFGSPAVIGVVIYDTDGKDFDCVQHKASVNINDYTIRGWFSQPGILSMSLPTLNFIVTSFEIGSGYLLNIANHEFLHYYQYLKKPFSDGSDFYAVRSCLLESGDESDLCRVICRTLYYLEPTERDAYTQNIISELETDARTAKRCLDIGIYQNADEAELESPTYDKILKFFKENVSRLDCAAWETKLREHSVRSAAKRVKVIMNTAAKFIRKLKTVYTVHHARLMDSLG